MFMAALTTVFFTYVRSTYLASIAVLIVIASFYRHWRRPIIFSFAVVALVGLLGWSEISQTPAFSGRILNLATFNERTLLFSSQMDALIKSPLVGYGVETARYMGTIWDQVFSSHNTFVTLLLGFGIVGAAPFFLALLSVVSNSVRLFRLLPSDHPGCRFLASTWAVMLAYITVANSVDFTVIPVAPMMFYVAAGLAMNADRLFGVHLTNQIHPIRSGE
jgi:O-antigen ligase